MVVNGRVPFVKRFISTARLIHIHFVPSFLGKAPMRIGVFPFVGFLIKTNAHARRLFTARFYCGAVCPRMWKYTLANARALEYNILLYINYGVLIL